MQCCRTYNCSAIFFCIYPTSLLASCIFALGPWVAPSTLICIILMPVTQSQKLPSFNGPSSHLKSPSRRLSASQRYNPISASSRCDVSIARIYGDRGSLASPHGSSKTNSTGSLSPVPQQYPLHGRAATTPIKRPPQTEAPVKQSQFPSRLPTLPSTSSPSLLGGPSSKCNQVTPQLSSTYQSPLKESLFASLRLQPPPGGTSRNHLFEVRTIFFFLERRSNANATAVGRRQGGCSKIL